MTSKIDKVAADAAAPQAAARRTREWILVALACTGQLIVVLDVSIVNVALPGIRASLGFSEQDLQWVVTAYTLTFAGFMLIGGRASDLFGRRRVFVLSLAAFTLASLAGGLAPNAVWLVVARTVQGIGGAVLAPATLAIITAAFAEGPKRTQAIATWTMMGAVGGAIGAVLGGVLTEFLSWRWVLLVNAPVGLVLAVLALIYLDRDADRPHGGLDILGSVTVTAGFIAVVYGLVEFGKAAAFDAKAAVATLIGIVLLVGFVVVETRIAEHPLLPLRIVRQRAVTVANLTMFLLGAGFFSVLYFVSLYLQGVRGLSALAAGLVFVPFAVTTVIGAQSAAKLLARGIPARPIIVAGTVISAAAFAALTLLDSDSSVGWAVIAPGLVVFLGIGLALAPTAATAIGGVAPQDAGVVSGLANATRQLGGSVGLAVLTIVAAARTNGAGEGIPTGSAVTHGYATAFGVAAVILIGAAISASLLPGRAGGQRIPTSRPQAEESRR
ncbi:DHA2 family efflux MFS transporter permease subunit [Nocardia sp. R7R-8]|uniref:DHA2 family efflux MFS transporter permease subunit n=1 Tax=Nocardia sp. R7R-8 TaxID=3459304 RepID=UPI00403D6059